MAKLSGWDASVLDLRTCEMFYHTDNYHSFKYKKFLNLIATVHDNKNIRDKANAIIAMKNDQAAQTELNKLEKLYADTITNSINKNSIDKIDDETNRKEFFVKFYKSLSANVEYFRKMLILRKESAQKQNYSSWSEYRTNGKTKELLNLLYAQMADVSAKANKELEILKKYYSQKEIYCFNERYYQKKYIKNNAPFEMDTLIAIHSILRFLANRLGNMTINQVPIRNYWTSENIKGNYQFELYDKNNDKLRGIILLDTYPREGKIGSGFTDQLAVECNLSSPDDVAVCYVSVANGEKCEYPDIKRLLHEFGHVFDIVLHSSKKLDFGNSGLNGIANDMIETMSQQTELYAKDPSHLSEIIFLPKDRCEKIIKINNSFYNIDWAETIAKAIFDLEIHDASIIPDAQTIVQKYNQTIANGKNTVQFTDVCTVANFLHLSDYSANYYVYIMGELRGAGRSPKPLT